jgi:hypothetical protein
MRSFFLALGLIAAPVIAQETVGNWTIEEVDHGCIAVTTSYAGSLPTSLTLGKNVNGRSIMIVQNSGWSTEEDKVYEVYVLIEDDFFSGTAHGGQDGSLVFNLKPEVMKAILKGAWIIPALKIDDSHEQVLEQLSLVGSSAAIARVDRCVEGVRASELRAERIPPDPFKGR